MNRAVLDEVDPSVKAQVLKLEVLDALRDYIGSEPLAQYLSDFIDHTAINIQRIGIAIAAEDDVRARHLAHKLKGSSGNIGALKLAWYCVELESSSAAEDPREILVSQFQLLEQVFQDTRQSIQSYIDGLTISQTSMV
ncbi:Hpt domain-containing protein [Kaarinaea lacus]